MLPTSPRLAARSMSSSCTAPACTTATRVSCGVMLTRTSSLTPPPHLLQKLRGFVQRQADDARLAAADLGDEQRRAPLDGVGAGLVVGLAGRDIGADLVWRELAELHVGDRERGFHFVAVELQRHGGQHFVAL